jgi:antirestriction protein ArdC
VILPLNPFTGVSYQGGNIGRLQAAMMANGWRSSEFATFIDWRKHGLVPRKGSKGTRCEYFGVALAEQRQAQDKRANAPVVVGRRVHKSFTLFNREQCDPVTGCFSSQSSASRDVESPRPAETMPVSTSCVPSSADHVAAKAAE